MERASAGVSSESKSGVLLAVYHLRLIAVAILGDAALTPCHISKSWWVTEPWESQGPEGRRTAAAGGYHRAWQGIFGGLQRYVITLAAAGSVRQLSPKIVSREIPPNFLLRALFWCCWP